MAGQQEITEDQSGSGGAGGECEITKVKALPNDPHRVTIHVDGKKRATLSMEQAFGLGLRVGVSFTPELAKAVDEAVGFHKAKRDALRVVRRRMIGTGELAERLKRREHSGRHIDAVIDELTERSLLNDETYGRALIEKIRLAKPAGRRLIQQKMTQRKLPKALIERLLDEALVDADPHAEARELAGRRLEAASFGRLTPDARRRRIVSLLQRRGYNMDAINAALAEHEDLLNGPTKRSVRAMFFDESDEGEEDDASVDSAQDEAEAAYASALALLQKKLAQPSMQKADKNARRRRLTGMLARKGHHYDIIKRAFEEAGV